MRKIIVGSLSALLLIAGAFITGAHATPPEDSGPGPNGHNNHGLCTAYFNGQKNGHEEGAGPGPFGALEDKATDDGSDEDQEDEQQVSDDVFEYCDQYGIGGNPELNGRFDCRDGEGKTDPARDEDTDGEIECVPNGTETPAP